MKIGSETDLRPMVHLAHRFNAKPEARWGPRTNPDFQLIYIISGEIELRLGKETYLVHPEECVYFGPGQVHQITARAESVLYSVHFEWIRESLEPIHPIPGMQECNTESLSDAYAQHELDVFDYGMIRLPTCFTVYGLESLLQRLVEEYWNEQPLYLTAMRVLLHEILTKIIRSQLPMFHNVLQSRIAPALQAIRNEPERNWSVQVLANLCGYHPNYFAEVFKSVMGIKPKEFLISERIKAAKHLLLTDMRMEDIAQHLGYSSIHYFSKNFKKVTGLTPTQFRGEVQTI